MVIRNILMRSPPPLCGVSEFCGTNQSLIRSWV